MQLECLEDRASLVLLEPLECLEDRASLVLLERLVSVETLVRQE